MAGKYRFIKGPISVGDANDKKRLRKNRKLQQVIEDVEKQSDASTASINCSGNLNDDFNNICNIFKDCADFVPRKFTLGEESTECFIAFIENLVKKEQVNDNILKPLMTDVRITGLKKPLNINDMISQITQSSLYANEIEEISIFGDAVKRILEGYCVLFIDGCKSILSINTRLHVGREVTQARIESVVRGPQEALVEDIKVNMALVRKKLKTPDLKIYKLDIGRLSGTRVVVAYIRGIADDSTVEEIKKRLQRIDTDMILDSGYIEKFIEDNPLSPFPQMFVTERPDTIVASLAEGRIAVLVDGSPTALLLPVTFSDFLTASEDYYTKFYFSSFLRLLRYLAFFIALLGPSLYIAVTTYHQEMIPLSLLITIARSRADVPFPAIIEALLMEVTFELLREAGIKLPQPVGPAVSIVGGLVIGQGVVQAGIISQTMVIVVAVTGIASFAIPAFNTAVTVRLLRFPIMILASILGMYGIIMGILVILIHLVGLRSAGVPYLSPFTPLSIKDLKDTVVMAPLWAMNKRASFIQKKNPARMKNGLKPGPESNGGG